MAMIKIYFPKDESLLYSLSIKCIVLRIFESVTVTLPSLSTLYLVYLLNWLLSWMPILIIVPEWLPGCKFSHLSLICWWQSPFWNKFSWTDYSDNIFTLSNSWVNQCFDFVFSGFFLRFCFQMCETIANQLLFIPLW